MSPDLKLLPEATWPIPDWSYSEKLEPLENAHEFWTAAGSEWMDLLAEYIGAPYQITESPHFWLICPYPAKQAIARVKWLEKTLHSIRKLLGPIAMSELIGKTPIVIFANDEDYYSYIANYYQEGEWSRSSGVYLNDGYGHFVIPESAESNLAGALSHEMTHALIENQQIPLWLNEGIAQLCEESIAGFLSLDDDTIREHIETFWNESTIQSFWNGTGFSLASESQTLCYHLAQLLTYRLINDRTRFDAFTQKANRADAGETSLIDSYGFSLQDLAESALGDGDWSYRKESAH